jgi:hypothetical protein
LNDCIPHHRPVEARLHQNQQDHAGTTGQHDPEHDGTAFRLQSFAHFAAVHRARSPRPEEFSPRMSWNHASNSVQFEVNSPEALNDIPTENQNQRLESRMMPESGDELLLAVPAFGGSLRN